MPTLDRAHLVFLVAFAIAPGFSACRRSENGVTAESPGGAGASTGGAGDGASREAGRNANAGERVTLATQDGWTLTGDYTSGAPGSAVLLVHQLSSNRSEWGPLIERLRTGNALAVLAIDVRGHGESTRGPDGTTSWISFGNDTARWSGLVTDVGAAITYVRGRDPSVQRIVIVGSSIGSSAAIRYAVDEPLVRGVVMLSPGASYRGLDSLEPLQRFVSGEDRAALLLAGDGDNRSAESVRALTTRAAGVDAGANVTFEIYAGTGAHGVALGAPGVHPEMFARIDAWIRGRIDPAAALARNTQTADAYIAPADASDPASSGPDVNVVADTTSDSSMAAGRDASATVATAAPRRADAGTRTRTRVSDSGGPR